MFNKKLSDFMAENPNQTILGFAWSLYWRLMLVILAFSFVYGFIVGLFGW